MKVKELIAELQKCDPEALVMYEYDGGNIEVVTVDTWFSEQFKTYSDEVAKAKRIRNIVELR